MAPFSLLALWCSFPAPLSFVDQMRCLIRNLTRRKDLPDFWADNKWFYRLLLFQFLSNLCAAYFYAPRRMRAGIFCYYQLTFWAVIWFFEAERLEVKI